MNATTPTSIGVEELITRESNGISVSLVWHRDDDRVSVVVFDSSTDTAFQLDIGGASPLDVFNHPYAYAAFRGIDTGPVPEQQVEQPVAA